MFLFDPWSIAWQASPTILLQAAHDTEPLRFSNIFWFCCRFPVSTFLSFFYKKVFVLKSSWETCLRYIWRTVVFEIMKGHDGTHIEKMRPRVGIWNNTFNLIWGNLREHCGVISCGKLLYMFNKSSNSSYGDDGIWLVMQHRDGSPVYIIFKDAKRPAFVVFLHIYNSSLSH